MSSLQAILDTVSLQLEERRCEKGKPCAIGGMFVTAAETVFRLGLFIILVAKADAMLLEYFGYKGIVGKFQCFRKDMKFPGKVSRESFTKFH